MKAGHADRVKLLEGTELFGELDPEALGRVAENLVVKRYGRRQLIFSQGEPAEALFIVMEGLVKVYVTSEEGDEMGLVTLRPPEVFGELSLIDGGPRSASAEAVQPGVLLALSRDAFLALRREHASLAEAVDRSLGRLLRRLTDQTADLVFLDLHGRVAKLLLAMAEKVEDVNGSPDELDLALTQQDLAAMVGGSRQSVNQILHAFERRGFVALDGRRIHILKPDLLARRAGL